MSESEIYVNSIIESATPPEKWEQELRNKNTPDLVNEYNATLAWLAALRQTDMPIQLESHERSNLNNVLTVLRDESAIRVAKITQHISPSTYLSLSNIFTELPQEDQDLIHSDKNLEDYFILAQLAQRQDQEEFKQTAKIKRKPTSTNLIVKLGATFALASLTACSSVAPPEPTLQPTHQIERTPTTIIQPTEKILPTSTPFPTETPKPQNTVVPFENNLIATAQALPSTEAQTLKNGEMFTEADIELIRKSVVSFTIEDPQGGEPFICTGQVIHQRNFWSLIATNRHCFNPYADINDFSPEDGFQIDIDQWGIKTSFSKPELNQSVQGRINKVYYMPGLEDPDFALAWVYIDPRDGNLDFPPFNSENIKPDLANAGAVRLNVSYPGQYIWGDREILAVNEGQIIDSNYDTVFKVPGLKSQTYHGVVVYEATTGPGSSGSFVYAKDTQTGEVNAIGSNFGGLYEVQDPSGKVVINQRAVYVPFTQDIIDWTKQVIAELPETY